MSAAAPRSDGSSDCRRSPAAGSSARASHFHASSMVQKAATVGITLLAVVSAPTALAIRLAEETGLTLIGFARTHQHVVYAHPQRLQT